jgi:lipopolysaccharide export system permease protein
MRIGLYILRLLSVNALVVVGVLCAVVWLVLSLRIIDFALNAGAPLSLFGTMVISLLPTFLPMVLPLGLMVALMFTYSQLTQESELVVMRAAGIGPLGLAAPALLVASVATAGSFALTLHISPGANRDLVRAQQLIREGLDAFVVREGQFTSFGDALTVYVRERGRGGELRDILLHDRQQPDKPAALVATRGQLLTGEGPPRLLVEDGSRQELDRTTGRASELSFERYVIEIPVPERRTAERVPDARERGTGELVQLATDPGLDERSRNRLSAELHQRIVLPLLIPGMSLLALAIMLRGGHHRAGIARRIAAGALAGVALQVATLAVLNAGGRDASIAAFAYVPPAAALAVGAGAFLLQMMPRRTPGGALRRRLSGAPTRAA